MVGTDGTINMIAGIACTQSLTTGCGPGDSGDGGPATAALLSNPLGVAVDAAGTLYIADADNNVIRKVSGGTIATLITLSSGAVVVQNSDFSLNQRSNPAAVGSVITAYLTGFGPVSGTVADGFPTPTSPFFQATSPLKATIGSKDAPVIFVGLTPTFVGLVQASIQVPSGLSTGDYPLMVTIAGESSNPANVSVKQ